MILHNKAPIIVIGMHRSGTTMLSKILEQLGCFMGNDLEINHESLFFLSINQWILKQYGARWDTPEALRSLPRASDISTKYLRPQVEWLLSTDAFREYLGKHNYRQFRKKRTLDFQWGWKDPRNTFTLPLWLELFSDAKIIFTRRHGVDVAASLHNRAVKIADSASRQWTRNRNRRKYDPWAAVFNIDSFSMRCLTLDGSFSLWEAYVEREEKLKRILKNQAIDFEYEAFLISPEEHIHSLCKFCDLAVSQEEISQIITTVNHDRGQAYLESNELLQFARDNHSRLAKYGYKPD